MSEDLVNHPSHYAEGWSNGAEVIDITENLNFNRGNAVKYIARAGRKNQEKELEDLQKAEFYLKREIKRISQRWDNPPTYQIVSWPRVWGSLADVPIGVKVTDNDGDLYEFNGLRWFWHGCLRALSDEEVRDFSPMFAPFTEVLARHDHEPTGSGSSGAAHSAAPDQEEDTQ